PWAMGGCGPDDGLAVATGKEKQTLADGGGAVVAGAQLLRFHGGAEGAQLADEFLQPEAFALFAGALAAGERAPVFEFFDVLQHDDARAHKACPFKGDPREAANGFVLGFAASGFAVVFAVRAEPGEPDGLALGDLARVNLP